MPDRTMTEKIDDGRVHAAAALAAYQASHAVTGAGDPDPDEHACIGDLLADLLHLAESIDAGWEDARPTARGLAMRAIDHYDHESDPANAGEAV